MKNLLTNLSQVYHRVEYLADSPKETTRIAATDGANVEEAATVSSDNNLFCKPASSVSEQLEFKYHISRKLEQ
jgi:hypothetical protein